MKPRTSRHILSLLFVGVAAACALFVGLILQLVATQNAIADSERQHRALAVLNNVAAVVRYDVTNTANWDEAYRRFADAPDETWFQENIGAGRYGKMNHVLAAVVDGAGSLVTGAYNGAPIKAFASDALMAGLSSSLRAVARSPGLSVGTFVDLDGVPVYASVGRICSHSQRGVCSGRFLVLATTVEELVQDVAFSTGWGDLDVVREAPPGLSLAVAGPDGQAIAHLTWKAPTPGFVALKSSAPSVGGALAIMGLCGFGLFQRVRRTTDRLEEATDTAQRLAVTDAHTGIMNRRGMQDAVERHLLDRKPFHLVELDLDGFKEINDTLGHETGDIVLYETARRLERMVPANGFVARLGGDEFVVLVSGASDSAVLEFGQDLVMSVHQPFAITGQTLSVSASVGVACGVSPMRADEVLRRADVAMYAAKSSGTGGIRLYEPHLDEAPMLMRRLDREMRDGLQHSQFHVEFQPILSVASGAFGGVEALLRWHHPARGMVSPSTFIPAAEKSRLIVELGDFVLREACLRLADRSDLSLSVNLSPVQLLDDQLAERVRRILDETGFDPARLEFEVTEGYLVSQEDRALKTLTRLREDLGLRVSLDDFGCGYASIGFLRRFPLDKIKIDRSFVQPIGDSPEARRLLLSMIGLCKAFEIPITAEGVETEAQSAFLRAAGCDNLQGFLLAKPSRTLPEVDADWRWDVA